MASSVTQPGRASGLPGQSQATDSGPAVTIVRTIADLAEIRSGRLGPRHRLLRLELPGLDDDEARAAADRLTSLRNECGCSMGARFMLAAIASTAAWLLLGLPTSFSHVAARTGAALATIILAGGIGKAVGIARARRMTKREVDALKKRVTLTRELSADLPKSRSIR